MSSLLKTALLLVALLCLKAHGEITCDHDIHQERNPPGMLDIEEDFSALKSGRFLQETDYPQMRIYANYENLDKTASASYATYIKEQLAPAVLSYYQAALRVKYPVSGNLVISSSVRSLCSLNTPTDLKNGVPADYAILITSRSESSDILATSYNCQVASGSKRPLVGSTSFNSKMLREANGDPIIHEKNTYCFLHEVMHTLGFSKSLHKYFIDANGQTLTGHVKSIKVGGTTHPVIDVPSLTEKLRAFHGCSTLPGAVMESGDASHWDKRFYLYETMQPGAISGRRMSELSLGLLEASGWYVVNYTYAEPYFYGQGQGCEFFNLASCSSKTAPFEEFCTGNSKGCNFVGNTGGSCSSGSDMDNCNYLHPSDSYNCESTKAASNAKLSSVEAYGRDAGSRCFAGTLSSSSSSSSKSSKSSSSTATYCFKYNCTGEGVNTQLEVILGNTTAMCTQQGSMTVAEYSGTITCPDPLTFCSTVGKKFCPKGCMGRGTCVDYKCQCDPGFTGIDCAMKV